jgi:hypothetical protein
MISATEWVFLAWDTFHRYEADALRATGEKDLTDSDRAAWKDIEGLLDRLGAPYGFTVSDVVNGFMLEAADPPGGGERLADYLTRPKLYQLSRKELSKMSPEDIQSWPPGVEHPQSISTQAGLRGSICRLVGAAAIRRQNALSPGWHLLDAEPLRFQYPDTWSHSTARDLESIEPGWLVKIGVSNPETPPTTIRGTSFTGERFWCRVKETSAENLIVMVVQSDMLYADQHGVHHGDRLTVERRHILDFELPDRKEIQPCS